jgi:hypothetical protein
MQEISCAAPQGKPQLIRNHVIYDTLRLKIGNVVLPNDACSFRDLYRNGPNSSHFLPCCAIPDRAIQVPSDLSRRVDGDQRRDHCK